MTLRLLTLGVGDVFSARHYSTSFAVESNGHWLLVDCPHPMRKMLREAAARAGLDLDLDALTGVVVTHLHANHTSGLESVGCFNHFALKRRATLLSHPLVAARLRADSLADGLAQLEPSGDDEPETKTFADFFDHVPLDETREVAFGPFAISCRRTVRRIPTTALRIEAGSRSLAYSADTAFDQGLIDWLCQSDLVLHETGYGLHTPYEKLAALPAHLRAKMRLIHYPDGHVGDPMVLQTLEEGVLYDV